MFPPSVSFRLLFPLFPSSFFFFSFLFPVSSSILLFIHLFLPSFLVPPSYLSPVSFFTVPILTIFLKALSLLPQMNLSPSSFRLASFFIHKHHYLELLSSSDLTSALQLLQNDLQKSCGDSENLYKLSSLLICKDPNELRSNIGISSTFKLFRNK